MKELTKAEEHVMQALWSLEKGFLKDIVDHHPEPTPAYTTVSTVVSVLVKKGVIGFNTYGKTREYFPTVSKTQYSRFSIKGLIRKFFDDSPSQFASFFTKDENITTDELESIQMLINQEIEKRK
ncbi:MAG: BlaI family penicillinase repressor [Cyclobacteriaceae bacterium]|jgi:BlaI family penicillinase repressor